MASLVLSNPKCVKFYENNQHINFEAVNILLVDFLENLTNNLSAVADSSKTSQILETLTLLAQDVNSVKHSQQICQTNLSNLNSDISNNMTTKLQEIKNAYANELKMVFESDYNTTSDHLNKRLDTLNDTVVQHIKTSLSTALPESQNILLLKLESFHSDLSKDTKHISQTIESSTPQKLAESFENKIILLLSNMQQNLSEANSKNNNTQEQVMEELKEFLGKYKNSSFKGQLAENKLDNILNTSFPSAEVVKTAGKAKTGDFMLVRGENDKIMIENKDYSANVSPSEIKKFIRDIEEQNCHGIFLSQYSGITSKNNFQIDIHNNNILLYLHSVNYNDERIKMAVDIIDNLSAKLKQLDLPSDSENISSEVLTEINKEYQQFITQKESLATVLRDSHKKTMQLIYDFHLPQLDQYLGSKFAQVAVTTYACNICNDYLAKNPKALAAHQRSCIKKTKIIINTEEES